MRIAINTRFLLSGKLEGIGIYTQEIVKRVVQQMPEHQFYFLFDRPLSKEFIFADNVIPLIVSPQARHPLLWYYWFEQSIPKVLKKYHIDLFFSPDGYCSLATSIPQIITIHDLGFEHYPEHTPLLVRNYYQHFTPKYCRKATQILAVSEFTKQDIMARYGIDENKMEVVYNGFEKSDIKHAEQVTYKNLSSDLPYFIFIGAVHPRKNVLTLLKAFEHYKIQSNSTHKLIIIGRKAWMNNDLDSYYNSMKFKQEVMWIEQCDRTTLLSILKNACAMVYPSWFEGFGIPIVEAMQLGVPVICSNVSAMPEIAGNAAILVNPNSADEIATAMQTISDTPDLRTALIQKGMENAKRFSWDVSANKVVTILNNIQDKL